jgi:hypothetical protein
MKIRVIETARGRDGETAQNPGSIGLIGYSGCGLRVACCALVTGVFAKDNGRLTTDKVFEL